MPSIVRIRWQQRRLGQESRTFTVMRLRSMDQKWVAQVYRAGVACRRDDRSMSACREAVSGEFPQRQPFFSCGRELASDIRMRADPNARRRIVLTDIGEQE